MITLDRKRGLVAVMLSLILLTSLGVIFFFNNESESGRFAEEAAIVIAACEGEDYKPSCYDKEIPKVMDRGLSFEESYKVTAIVQAQDDSYWYCHVLGHNLSAKETAKDVSKWTEVVARAPSGMCSNGSLHGAFQERFRGEFVSDDELEELIPEIKSICRKEEGNRDFTGLEQASCYHALGHLTMYITNANVEQSVQLCDRVSIEGEQDFSNLCYDGAYMQIFQPLEPEDIALVQDIEPKTQKDAMAFCNAFSGSKRTSCMMESWPLFVDEFDTKFGAIESFCSRDLSKRDTTRCLNGVFYVMSARSNFEEDKIADLCSYVSSKNKAQCYANSASRFLETDYKLAEKAIGVCDRAREDGVSDSCYDELLFYSSYNYKANSEPFLRLCEALPSPWKEKCVNNEGNKIPIPFYDS